MIKLLGSRGASAVMGFFMLTLASAAPAQTTQPTTQPSIAAAIEAASVDSSAKPLGTAASPVVIGVRNAVTSVASAVSTAVGNVLGTMTVKPTAKPDIAKEAAWLHSNGWGLYALVDRYAASGGPALDEQANCIAVAVYHEARGESLDGQLAVARVIMNRAASGKYPPSWCATVKQPWQFSFVRNYQFPYTDQNCDAWRKAVAVTRLAVSDAIPSLSNDVLWYHADYVAPSWGRRLTRVNKIGTHIFYRA
ncbi:MAG: cell wall hydrolase [Sphingomonas sp.]|nr:cell wall hydrolase [Sphingomonas sp.]